jgi:hypothetical protein
LLFADVFLSFENSDEQKSSLPGGAVAQYAANGGFYYRHPDWQGSTRLVTQEGTPWINFHERGSTSKSAP